VEKFFDRHPAILGSIVGVIFASLVALALRDTSVAVMIITAVLFGSIVSIGLTHARKRGATIRKPSGDPPSKENTPEER
jgi:hypothetical protein